MSMIQEFKEFAMRGNVIDMAVGIVIGLAFGAIVTSLVADIIMPPIGLLVGGVDFNELTITLREAVNEAEAVTINYGIFIKTIVDFLLIAVAIFMVIKGMNRLKRKEEEQPAPAAPPKQELLLEEIRDILKTR